EPGGLHRPPPADLPVERLRAAADAAVVAAAGRRVEPGQRAHRLHPPAVGQPEPVRRAGLPGRAPDPAHPHLGGRPARRVRPTGGAALSLDEPLSAGAARCGMTSDRNRRARYVAAGRDGGHGGRRSTPAAGAGELVARLVPWPALPTNNEGEVRTARGAPRVRLTTLRRRSCHRAAR